MNSQVNTKRREPNLLSVFEDLCARHRVKKVNSLLRRILDGSSTTTAHEKRQSRGGSTLEVTPNRFGSASASASPLESIDLSSVYVGPRQLMALADLLRPVRGSSTRDTASGEWFYFSLVPFLSHLSLADMQLDFTVSETDAIHARATTTNGTAVMRYVLEALHHHPSLAVLDLDGNPVGPHLFTALCRLLAATRTLTELRLSGSLLLEEQRALLETKVQENKAWCDAHRGAAWRRHYVVWKGQQLRWTQDTFAQKDPSRRVLPVSRSAEVVDWVCHFTDTETESFPFLQYYTPGAPRRFLSPRCVEMLQGAFNPVYFERMGTSAPVNTPQVPLHFRHAVKNKEELEELKCGMAHSNLLVAARDMLFPTDPGLYDTSLGSPTSQIRSDQWDTLLSCLAHFMVPAYYHLDEVVYYLNDRPYWLSYLPYSEEGHTRNYVKQLCINKETGLYDEVFVHEGQFFGCEVVGGASLYGGASPSPLLHQRDSTATVHNTAELQEAHRCKNKRVRVWQLPFEVAFFFLFQPFCEFHGKTAARLSTTPRVQTWAPHLQYLLSYVLHFGAFVEKGVIEEAPSGTVLSPFNGDLVTVMDARRFRSSVTLLVEGRFVVRGYDRAGRWSDRAVAAPAVLIDHCLYTKDEPEREVMKHMWSPKNDLNDSSSDDNAYGGGLLGKEGMLEQYRAGKEALVAMEGGTGGEPLALCAHRSSPHRWCSVEGARFETLPLTIRLQLTKNCIIV